MEYDPSFANLAVAAAGLAIVVGVVALLTSAEVAKRLQLTVSRRLIDSEQRLAMTIQRHDERMNTLRNFTSQKAEANEIAINAIGEDVRLIKERIAQMVTVIDRLDGRRAEQPDRLSGGPGGWPRKR